jgi:DNA-binding NtrC family response regulator
VTVELPPLRHRRGDVPELLAHFLARERQKHPGSCVESFAPDALEVLLEYPWPGNVGELELLVERAVVLSRSPSVEVSDLPSRVRMTRHPPPAPFSGPVLSIRELERRYAAWAFDQLDGRRALAAEKLGIDDETLASWLRERTGSGAVM